MEKTDIASALGKYRSLLELGDGVWYQHRKQECPKTNNAVYSEDLCQHGMRTSRLYHFILRFSLYQTTITWDTTMSWKRGCWLCAANFIFGETSCIPYSITPRRKVTAGSERAGTFKCIFDMQISWEVATSRMALLLTGRVRTIFSALDPAYPVSAPGRPVYDK